MADKLVVPQPGLHETDLSLPSRERRRRATGLGTGLAKTDPRWVRTIRKRVSALNGKRAHDSGIWFQIQNN